MDDLISRQQAIDALRKLREEDIEDYGCEIPEGFNQDHLDRATFAIKQLPPIQPEIVRCKDCQYWNSGSCEYPEHAVNCQDYMIGDIETEAEHFCGYAERREVTE